MTGERFIPFRKTSIITMCADEVTAEERESFEAFAELLASLLHHEFRAQLEALKEAYYPFNPDADTRTLVELGRTEREAAQQRLVDELTSLAEDANFERISSDDLGRAFVEESLMKVRLEADFDDFEQVVFYRRGEHTRQEEVKYLFGLRRRTVAFTNYAKVLVYVKFKDAAYFEGKGRKVDDLPFSPGSTIIKLFQDVPRADLEMLFPNARVRMRLINDTMMAHPIHIHGHFWELVNGQTGNHPLKHTVNVQPGGTVDLDLTADAPGDWAFHCHLLLHMHAGMMRVVKVRPLEGGAA